MAVNEKEAEKENKELSIPGDLSQILRDFLISSCSRCKVSKCNRRADAKHGEKGGCFLIIQDKTVFREAFGWSKFGAPVSEFQPACSNFKPKEAQLRRIQQ